MNGLHLSHTTPAAKRQTYAQLYEQLVDMKKIREVSHQEAPEFIKRLEIANFFNKAENCSTWRKGKVLATMGQLANLLKPQLSSNLRTQTGQKVP